MSKPIILYYPLCSTCRKAITWLKEKNIEVERRDITLQKPSVRELDDWIKISGKGIYKFFNTSGKIYKDNHLKETVKTKSYDELLQLLSSNGMIVKRPLLISPDFTLVGFNEKEWSEKLLKQCDV